MKLEPIIVSLFDTDIYKFNTVYCLYNIKSTYRYLA